MSRYHHCFSVKSLIFSACILFVTPLFWVPSTAAAKEPAGLKKPLKVYILAGQSNMQGHARTSTFAYVGADPATKPLYQKMTDPTGSPRVVDGVYIRYVTATGPWGRATTPVVRDGTLAPGFGGDPAKENNAIGPEYTFGITMRESLKEPILLIKTAWGGESLHTDFRPPSAGPFVFSDAQKAAIEKNPKMSLKEALAKKKAETGHYYRLMVSNVRQALAEIKKIDPDYDESQGYELAGFVWFQGFNDMVDGGVYPNTRDGSNPYASYSKNLACLIRDVRLAFQVPDLPVVIGVMGVDGTPKPGPRDKGTKPKGLLFREAMAAPAALPEFKGTVKAVWTDPYWDAALVTAVKKKNTYDSLNRVAYSLSKDGTLHRADDPYPGWHPIGKAPENRMWRYLAFDVQKASDTLPATEGKRFRNVSLPAGVEGWQDPAFDDSAWKTGRSPIGVGVWKRGGVQVVNGTNWGKGEFLLARATFDYDGIDDASIRLSILARQGYEVYLNGQLLHRYIWWQNSPVYSAIVLNDKQRALLRKGANVLAIYTTVAYDREGKNPYTSVNLFFEGITKEGVAARDKALDKVCSPEDRETAKGASNQSYHYMGSAKILGQIGVAFAKAMLDLDSP